MAPRASSTAAKDTRPAAVIEIERLGFTWTLDPQYDISGITPADRVQVREVNNYARPEDVKRFAVQMGESTFPPIIMTLDGKIVEGNTRVGAAKQRKMKFFPAYVLDVEWAGATTTEEQKGVLYALATTLNMQNGRALTKREVRNAITHLIKLEWKAEQIARAAGVPQSLVNTVKREMEAERKLIHVGLDANGSTAGVSLRTLGSPAMLQLHDEPYKALTLLAADSGYNATELSKVTKDIAALGSDKEQLAAIEALRTEDAARISNRALTGRGNPSLASQLRQRLGFITKHAGSEANFVELNDEAVAEYVKSLESAVAVLNRVIELQAA